MYSAKLLDHFEHPRNAGELPDATARVKVENPACGDIMELAVRLENGVITKAAFKAKGCVPAMACASAVTELIKGKSLHAAAQVSRNDVLSAVEEVPPASGHALELAIDAVRALLRSFRKA